MFDINLNRERKKKMNAETIKSLASLLAVAGEYRPLVEGVVKAIEEYGPDLKKIFASASIGMIDVKADCIDHLVNNRGFTKEQAIIIAADQWSAVQRAMSQNNSKSKS